MKEPVIVASVLGADYARLGHEVAELEAAGVDRVQWDIMDGRFVPNLTFGAEVVGACRPYATVPFEAHLMVEDPDQWLFPGMADQAFLGTAESRETLFRPVGAARRAE